MPSADGDRDRARGALLGTFVGDTLGMPYEGAPPAAVPALITPQHARLGRGTYTDDTQMMIALAESILACDDIDDDHLARSFLDAYDAHRGYGAGTLEVFRHWRSGVPVADAAPKVFGGSGSYGNGAAMRVAPVAVRWPSPPVALGQHARRSARLTHAHAIGSDGAVVLAAAVAAALRGDDILATASGTAATPAIQSALGDAQRLLLQTPSPAKAGRQLGNSSAAHASVPTAVYAAVAHDDFAEAVTFAIRCGGDTDTIGAMAGAIAGARGGASTIPSGWLNALENGDRGRDHVASLADALAERATRHPMRTG